MDVLYLVAPAYNEADNIEQFIREWYPVVERHAADGASKLVVIDDGSKDDTYALLVAMNDEYPQLVPLTKPNGGHGAAVLHGYRHALENGADYVFQTDSDGQTDPNEFDAFWDAREQYDAQFGNRTVRGDGKQRAFVERVVCLLVRLYFGVKVPDANAPFRLMSRGYLEEFLPLMPADYALPNIVLTALGPRFRRKVRFRIITFKPRTGGENSINMKRIASIGWQSLKDFAAIRRNVKQREREYILIEE